MGYFRRFKTSDHSAEDCRKQMMKRLEALVFTDRKKMSLKYAETLAEEWACFRELLARHENRNQSPLDQ